VTATPQAPAPAACTRTTAPGAVFQCTGLPSAGYVNIVVTATKSGELMSVGVLVPGMIGSAYNLNKHNVGMAL
jgi:hypothetical protein